MQISEIAALLNSSSPLFDCDIETLLTDSRSLENPDNTIFFAIPTKGNDGHKYIHNLFKRGVRNFVVNYIPDEMTAVPNLNWIIVDDSIKALQTIARRSPNFSGKILAITGSRGKTTLKEWIFQLMEPLTDIARSPRSFNSQIGVPLSMWGVKDSTSLAVIEAGISKTGEMQNLAECICPDVVIITNIGDAHADGFDSPQQKAEEKARLANNDFTKSVIFSADMKIIAEAVRKIVPQKNTLTWSLKGNNADIQINASTISKAEMKIEYSFNDIQDSFTAPFASESDLENGANALAFMLYSKCDSDTIKSAFANLHKIGTRLNVSDGINGCSIILDSYTSDFSSLRPALDFMKRRKTPSQSSVLILSDLHHEDIPAPLLYQQIADLVERAAISEFIGVGPILSSYKEIFPSNARFFNDTKELIAGISLSDFSDNIILLKGSPEFNFSYIAETLEARKHETVLEVNLDAIIENFNYFRSKLPSNCGIVCMVKASGYGAGSYEIAKTLQDCGAAYLAVAVLDEGIELRRKGITMPIMVMNPKVLNYKAMFAWNLEPEIYCFDMLLDVISEAKKNNIKGYPVHIKLDTGMHRMGFVGSELPKVMEILNSTDAIVAKSTFSHLATADCPDMNDYTELQLSRFAEYTDFMLHNYPHKILRHVLNSAGILRYPEHHYDMSRLGIGLYGVNTLPPEMERPLAVVSTLRTVIIAIRDWEPGETIGYGRHGKITRKSRIATIPIGYADGMNRHFGRGNISVWINGKEAPTIGNICMDACMIDVTDVDCEVGDSVEIFGKNAPVQRLADVLDTIPYEVLTSVSPRVKRIYFRE